MGPRLSSRGNSRPFNSARSNKIQGCLRARASIAYGRWDAARRCGPKAAELAGIVRASARRDLVVSSALATFLMCGCHRPRLSDYHGMTWRCAKGRADCFHAVHVAAPGWTQGNDQHLVDTVVDDPGERRVHPRLLGVVEVAAEDGIL